MAVAAMTAKVTPTDTDAAAARDDESAQSPAAPKHAQSMLRPHSEPISDGATAKRIILHREISCFFTKGPELEGLLATTSRHLS